MAEQVSHNVVDYSESTGESLVDVAANQTTVPSADYGAASTPETQTTETPAISQDVNEYATHSNKLISSMQSDPHVAADLQFAADDASPHVAEDTGVDSSNLDYSQLVNGVHDASGAGDGLADDASVDVSLNSDTEGSRGDASDLKNDDKHHTRTNSVKKPTIFSKVSVTKNFLAKSATVAPATVKPGEKPSTIGTPPQPMAAKPRLIAKTGPTLRDVQKARLGTDISSGPDASKVWNKNRPVAPPPPKQFTDEELKQQYGIHLATRLQADENGKESKWADIDDDEDDWAPDAVVWMDGTKSTLTPNEAATLAQKDQKPEAPQPTKVEGVRPMLAMKRPGEQGLPGPTKTILKPGASTAAAQAKQNDSDAASAIDRASSTTKSPATVPTKSPWAPLPPVDKISPINPPVQQIQPMPMFSSQDARAYEPLPPPPPAREIAADTFDRTWQEGGSGTRELFNAANGRYEPAPEGGRRGSMKPDQSYRKPAVLQRPSQTAIAPAEPSAAFQTRSTSQVDGPWARRRGSSVSQGSIPSARRMSVSKTSDMSPAPERRTSTVIGHDMRNSPSMARAEAVQPPVFPQQSTWQQQMPPRPESSDIVEEDPVKVQERVMKEKRELAKRRREEEEARLEAEKQERLKAKLASLETAGKSRKEREAEAAAAAATVKTPASEMAPGGTMSAAPGTGTQPPATAEPANTMPQTELPSQPLQSTQETVVQKQPTPEELLPAPLPTTEYLGGLTEIQPLSPDQPREQPRPHLSPRANVRAPFQQTGSQHKASASSFSSPGDRKQQPFVRSPLQNADGFTPWPTSAPTGNVWGSSGIGNGTFESASSFAPIPMSQQSSSLPPPPGMSRAPGSSRISPQSLSSEARSPNLQQQSISEAQRGFAPPGLEAQSNAWASQGRVNGASPAPGLGRPTHLPAPIGPPSRTQQQQPGQRQDGLAAWNNAAHNLPYQFKSDAEAAKLKEIPTATVRDDTFKEIFRQTAAEQGKLGAPRRYDKTEYTVHDAQGSRSVQSHSPVPPSSQTQPSGPFSAASPVPQDPWKAAGENTVRIPDPSLNPAHGGSAQVPIGKPNTQQAISAPHRNDANLANPMPPAQDAKDPSPPPPETVTHPVNSGDAKHPLVKLPPEKPKVKLPPSAAPQSPSFAQHTAAVIPPRPIQNWGAPGSSRPIVMQEAWQARFNGLFNRTPIQTETPPSPPKTPPKVQGPALAVASSSRAVMDEASAARGAIVSLPQVKQITSAEGFTIDDSDDIVSKPAIEQMFDEELSFGSLPKISIPRNAMYDSVFEPQPSHNLLRMGATPRDVAVDAQSQIPFNFMDLHPRRKDGYFVHLPQMQLKAKFIHHKSASRKPSAAYQERKTSGKYKGKGRDSWPTASSTNSGTSNIESKKFGVQKGVGPTTASDATDAAAPTEPSKKTTWAKPPKGRGRGPPPVKAA